MDETLQKLTDRAVSGDAAAQFQLGMLYHDDKEREDYRSAAKWIVQAADQGYSEALKFLTKLYAGDQLIEQDISGIHENARDDYWWQPELFELQNPDATHGEWSQWYASEYSRRHDMVESFYDEEDRMREEQLEWELLRKRIEMLFNVGVHYYNKKDHDSAFRWWIKTAELCMHESERGFSDCIEENISSLTERSKYRLPEAQFILGVLYHRGWNVPQDFNKAGKLFEAAANQNMPLAQMAAGLMVGEGLIESKTYGVSQQISYWEAYEWYILAGWLGIKINDKNNKIFKNMDDIDREYALNFITGNLSCYGLSVSNSNYEFLEFYGHDRKTIRKWILKSAVIGDLRHIDNLVELLFKHSTSPVDDIVRVLKRLARKAETWYTFAQDLFAVRFVTIAEKLEEKSEILKGNEILLKWYTNAAKQGHAGAAYKLALMYTEGRVVQRNEKEAVKWFTKAALKEHIDAQISLAEIYKQGRGVPQNDQEAAKWYTKAEESRIKIQASSAYRVLFPKF